jgi:hypothetical protein
MQRLHRKTDPISRRRGGTICQTRTCLGEKISQSKVLTRPTAKNDCAGEDQQQINGTTDGS